MNSKYLVSERKKVETQYPHLFRLLSDEERYILEQDASDTKTPLWEHWHNYVSKSLILGKSPQTIKSVRDALNTIMRHTGLFTIEQFNEPGILDQALLELQLERRQKASTRNTYIKNCNTYFIWLFKNHIIKENNVARIEKGRVEAPDEKPLTLEQVEKITLHMYTRKHQNALQRARNILIVDIFRFSGIRPCELLGMANDAIFLEDGRWKMIINGRKQKGRKRYYEVPQFVVHSYQHYMRLRSDKERWETPLIISMTTREGLTTTGIQNLFKTVSKEIGFRVTAYGFRRFIATQLSKLGIKQQKLSRYLGHTRFTTSDLYVERECYLTQSGTDLMKQVYQTPNRS